MTRETLQAEEAAPEAVTDEPRPAEAAGTLATRLFELERAYEDLQGLVQRYERERAEIRERIARLLSSLGALEALPGR